MAAQWQRRDKDLGVQTKPGRAEHHCVLQLCVKKSSHVKRAHLLGFLMNESNQSFLLSLDSAFS